MSVRCTALVYARGLSEIDLGRREYRVRGVGVELGGRSFDILAALVRAGGQLVTKDDLIDHVWNGNIVEENTIQVHISAIRKALGPDRTLLKTVFGGGYRLAGNWTIQRQAGAVPPDSVPGASADQAATLDPVSMDRWPHADPIRPGTASSHNLPARVASIVGRDATISDLCERLETARLVCVTGPGGIGKTTVALAVGHRLLETFEGAVCFVDLAPVTSPSFVPDAVASALGLDVRNQDSLSAVIAFLRNRLTLLILDNCEHLVETAARLAETILRAAPRARILATSREALRIENEHRHVLSPLETPPEQAGLTAAEALTFPAVRLFVERAIASNGSFAFTDADAPVVGGLCRTLDGQALAIELAAGRAGSLGVRGVAGSIDGQVRLLWRGHRAALPRHRTLAAMLDWSHALLPEPERIVFRRLSIFAGGFAGLQPALAVSAINGLDERAVINAVDALIAKSLLTADFSRRAIRYRLLDTTRAYAAGKLRDSGEAPLVARCHANWFLHVLEQVNAGLPRMPDVPAGAEHIDNVRVALESSFGADGEPSTATALAAAAAPLFLRLSLLAECRRWTEQAISLLDKSSRGTRLETELLASLGAIRRDCLAGRVCSEVTTK